MAITWIVNTPTCLKSVRDFVEQELVLPEDGRKPWLITAELYNPRRSDQQNRLFHLWCGQVASHSGESSERVKFWLKRSCHGFEVIKNRKGEAAEYVKSSAEYTPEEMAQLIDHLDMVAKKLGITLTIGNR